MTWDKNGIARMLLQPPNRSIGVRILLLFVCGTALLVTVLGFLSYRFAAQSLVEQSKASSEQAVTLAGEKLDMRQQFYADLSNQLINNSNFTKHLFQITIPDLGASERERRIGEIQDMLGQLALSDSSIRDITLIPLEDNIDPISTNGEKIVLDLNEPWIGQIRQKSGVPLWLPVRDNGYLGLAPKPLIAFGKLLGKQNIGSRDFILLIQVDATVLYDMIEGVQLSAGGESAVLDGKGQPLAVLSPSGMFAALPLPEESLSGSFQSPDGELLFAYRTSPLSGWSVVGTAPARELTGAADSIGMLTIGGVVGGIAVALGVGLSLMLAISKPLAELETLMTQAARGDFRGRMRGKRKDEIGRVSEAYNILAGNIGELVAETHRTVEELAQSSSHISNAATETARSAAEVADASEQIARGAIGLSTNSKEGARQVERMGNRLEEAGSLQERMADSARGAAEAGHGGEVAARGLLGRTNEAELKFRNVSERVDSLNAGALSIRELLQFMTDMVKKIKILSFNASIEAVRAGGAGAGFKVIAEEIRSLADRSGASIGMAEGLTDNIQAEVAATVLAIQDVLPMLKEMIGEARIVSGVIEDVRVRTDQVLQCSASVTGALEQLQDFQKLMARSILEVSAVAQQSSVSTEQVASLSADQTAVGQRMVGLSEHLQVISFNLEAQMRRFQVD